MPALLVLNGPTIDAGESLSDGVDCSEGPLVKVTMPPEWDNANITFQTSTDGVFYNDMFDTSGHELSFQVRAGTAIYVDRMRFGWVKFRSGTRDNPVPQSGQRAFAVAIDAMPILTGDSP
jgi:hypothetical protein